MGSSEIGESKFLCLNHQQKCSSALETVSQMHPEQCLIKYWGTWGLSKETQKTEYQLNRVNYPYLKCLWLEVL